MGCHSKSNKGCPDGFLLQVETEAVKGAEIVNTTGFSLPSKDSTRRTCHIPKNPYLITKAYSEPLGMDLVEKILLQRNFIID